MSDIFAYSEICRVAARPVLAGKSAIPLYLKNRRRAKANFAAAAGVVFAFRTGETDRRELSSAKAA